MIHKKLTELCVVKFKKMQSINEEIKNKICEFHIDICDPETFVVGRLVDHDEKYFLIEEVSPYGRWNGLSLYMKSDVVGVECNSDYLNKMICLLEFSNQQNIRIDVTQKNDSLLHSFISFAKNNEHMIGMELHKSGERDAIGYVQETIGGIVCIDQIDEFAKNDGRLYVSTEAITRCFLCDEYLIGVERLRNLLENRKFNS